MDKGELLSAMTDSYAKQNGQIGKMTDDDQIASEKFEQKNEYGYDIRLFDEKQKGFVS